MSSKPLVLIVDDDPAQSGSLAAILRHAGFRTAVCRTASEAMVQVRDDDIAVAVVELQLPDLDGESLIEQIRQFDGDVRVVVHTAHGSYESAKSAVNLGVSAYVEKGSDPQELVRHVRRAVEARAGKRSLREARDRAQNYLDIAAVMFVALDAKGNITMVNQQACEILGYATEELIDRNWFQTCLPVAIRDEVFDVYRRLMAGDMASVEYYENPVVTRDGDERLIAWHNTILRDEDGLFIGTLSSGEDITERRKGTDALRASEARFRSLVEQSPIGIVLYRPDGTVRYGNPAARTVHRLTDEAYEYLLANYNLFQDEQLEAKGLLRSIEKAFQGQVVSLPPTRYDPKESSVPREVGSEPLHLESHAFPIKDNEGRVIEVALMHNDVTDRARAEEQLRQRDEEIAHMGRLHTVGEMATTLAHELNQPLSAISNYVHGTRRRMEKGSLDLQRLAEVLHLVSAEVDRASGVVSHLREFLRKGEPQRRDVDMATLVGDLMTLIEADTRRHGIRVHLDVDENISLVHVDPIQIEQVMVNLVRNAIESMPATAGRERTLEITARVEDTAVEVAIADTGDGLSEDVRQRCFEAFFTTKRNGLGMGLTICRSIIEAHGGRIWVTGNRPRGTIVHWTVPLPKNGRRAKP